MHGAESQENEAHLPGRHAHEPVDGRDRVEVPCELGVLGHLVLVEDDGASCRVGEAEGEQDGEHVAALDGEAGRVLRWRARSSACVPLESIGEVEGRTWGTVRACRPTTEKKSESRESAG